MAAISTATPVKIFAHGRNGTRSTFHSIRAEGVEKGKFWGEKLPHPKQGFLGEVNEYCMKVCMCPVDVFLLPAGVRWRGRCHVTSEAPKRPGTSNQ